MMRDKKRYLLIESTSALGNNEREFSASVYREVIRCIGEANYHKINPRFIKFVGANRFIIRSSLDGINQLVLSFALIKRLNNSDVAFYTLKSSGTIRALGSFKE